MLEKRFVTNHKEFITYYDINPSNARTIVFIHGNSHSSNTFIEQRTDPQLNGYRLILIDLPGHGKSTSSSDYSLVGLGKVVSQLINHLDINEYVLVGHSLGGHVAIQSLFFTKPQGLFLFGTPPLKKPFDQQAFQQNSSSEILFQEQFDLIGTDYFFNELRYPVESKNHAIMDFKITDPQFRVSLLPNLAKGLYLDELVVLSLFEGKIRFLIPEDETLVNNKYITDNFLNNTNNGGISFSEIIAGHSPHVEQPMHFNFALNEFCNETLISSNDFFNIENELVSQEVI